MKLSICDLRPMILTFLFAQLRISESVMSLPRVRDRRLLRSWSIWVLINCHKKPETNIHTHLHCYKISNATWHLLKLKEKVGVITKDKHLIPFNYVTSCYIYERESYLFPNLHNLIAVHYFFKRHLNRWFWSMFPVNWAWIDLVKNFKKNPSA